MIHVETQQQNNVDFIGDHQCVNLTQITFHIGSRLSNSVLDMFTLPSRNVISVGLSLRITLLDEVRKKMFCVK